MTPHRAIPADRPAPQHLCGTCGGNIILSEWDKAPCHDTDYLIDPDPNLSMPTGVDYLQARVIREATDYGIYDFGDREVIAVVTRLDQPVEEGEPGWFIDAQWVRFIEYEYSEWSFVGGTGDNDPGGPWFAQWLRHPDINPDDPGIWVAVGIRPKPRTLEDDLNDNLDAVGDAIKEMKR